MNSAHDHKKGGRNKHIVIAGGSGFLGMNLARYLTERGYFVTILSRGTPPAGSWKHVTWDGRSDGAWRACMDGADGLVNLAGRTVDCRKTPEHCDEILRSRVESTTALGVALRNIERPPPVWVQMSTAYIYGDPPRAMCTEDSAHGYGLAPLVGQAWERAFADSVLPMQRQVILRTSFVLGGSGGAFPKMRMLARCFLGGKAGHGRQGISWIHEQDMNRLFEFALNDDRMRGMYIATAPNPVSNRNFMRALRKATGRPFGLPAAMWMIRFGARWVMNTDPELILLGRYCRSERLAGAGFEFEFPGLDAALANLCNERR